MKRTYKYALTLVLGMALSVSAFAQTSFPDVEDSHWAADTIRKMKLEKLIDGYPDGTFDGKRMASRYEMACMLYAIYSKGIFDTDDLDKRLKALEAKINGFKAPVAPTEDTSDIKSSISGLRSDLASMRAWGDDIKTLKSLTSKYESDLKAIGADVDEMKKNLSSLSDRVSALEKKAKSVSISGDINFFAGSLFSATGFGTVINQDGRFIQTSGTGAGIDSFTVLHEMGLRIATPAATSSVPVVADFVVGNMLSDGIGGFGNQSQMLNDTPYNSGGTSVYLHRLTAMVPQYNATVGRQGLQLNEYILKRFDSTSFFENARYDDGNWMFDGVTFALGNAGYDANGDMKRTRNSGRFFIGNVSNNTTSNGGIVQPMSLGNIGINRIMGGTYNVGLGNNGGIEASYISYDSNGTTPPDDDENQSFGLELTGSTPPAGTNRFEVYGADLSFGFGAFKFSGGAGKSVSKQAGTILNDDNNTRYNAAVSVETQNTMLQVAFKKIEANYFAPGDWGRVSLFRNINDVQELSGAVAVKLTDKLSVKGTYGRGEQISTDGEYKNYVAGFDYQVTSKWNFSTSFENTEFDNNFKGLATNATSRFTTFGLGYDMGASTLFKLWYQLADTSGVAGAPLSGIGFAQRGGFLGAQLTVKF